MYLYRLLISAWNPYIVTCSLSMGRKHSLTIFMIAYCLLQLYLRQWRCWYRICCLLLTYLGGWRCCYELHCLLLEYMRGWACWYGLSYYRRIWEDDSAGMESVVYFLHIWEDGRATMRVGLALAMATLVLVRSTLFSSCVSGRMVVLLWNTLCFFDKK